MVASSEQKQLRVYEGRSTNSTPIGFAKSLLGDLRIESFPLFFFGEENMKKREEEIKVAFVGGFLGSGKTTLLIEVGKKLVSEYGKRVAIITNDQGEVLVDTKTVRDTGLAATEVVRGCFCCKFLDLIESADKILKEANSDIILAEPVGSCMDISATVIGPLQMYYRDRFTLAPLLVLVDASGILGLSHEQNLSSPTKPAGYLISGQIHEAEVLGINKIDLISNRELGEVTDLVKKINSRARTLEFSAKTGAGLDRVIALILQEEHQPYSFPKVDYDVYAEAEAELGWFNGSWTILAKRGFEPRELIKDLLTEIAREVKKRRGKIAHLKLHFVTEKGRGKASLVVPDLGVDFLELIRIPGEARRGYFTLNARVKIDPKGLEESIRKSLEAVTSEYAAKYGNWEARCFAPAPPRPYYRVPRG